MGAGISSLSKTCIVGDGSKYNADVTYEFIGIGIEKDEADYNGNCGNIGAAIGPYT
jgi:2-methylaconitate cis-trans-isomerase PrpF